MKNLIQLIASLSVLAIILVALQREDKPIEGMTSEAPLSEAILNTEVPRAQFVNNTAKVERKSITFIMGEDKKERNPYYQEAMQYYRHHPTDGTDFVNNDCRSLVEVQKYLEENPPANGLPWGTINVVIHSNEWMGMSVSVKKDGPRATPLLIDEAVDAGLLQPLNNKVADRKTNINMLGCGLGKNEEMVDALQMAFTTKNTAKLKASPYFVNYQSEKYNGRILGVKKKNLKPYYAFYKTGYRPGDIKLSRQLKQRYPSAEVNWRDALTRKVAGQGKELYHYTFRVPIVWTVTYADKSERPELKTDKEKMDWLIAQEELQEVLDQWEIPSELFNWTFRKINYTFEDGETEPGVKVIGFCTILCVLENVE